MTRAHSASQSSREMKADQTTSLYVDAPPLAVFSVLSDLENRPKIIRNVKRTQLETLPPVGAGTRFREQRTSLRGYSGVLEIGEFMPPYRLTIQRHGFGIPLTASYTLVEENAGTRLQITVEANGFLSGFPAKLLARRWKRQLDDDLVDIKRHVGQRADPSWRQGL